MIALSVLLGAFASNAAPGGYGGPPTSKPTPSTPVTTHPHPHPCNPHAPFC
jgi:hypothetical protein